MSPTNLEDVIPGNDQNAEVEPIIDAKAIEHYFLTCGRVHSINDIYSMMDEAAEYCSLPCFVRSGEINFDNFRKFMLSFIED